jgi:hypothetical protein
MVRRQNKQPIMGEAVTGRLVKDIINLYYLPIIIILSYTL